MGTLSVADLPEWVWLGNVNYATYRRISDHFDKQGIALAVSGPKDRADITREDLRSIAKVKAHFGASAVYEVLPTRSSEEMIRQGMAAVYCGRNDLALGLQAA